MQKLFFLLFAFLSFSTLAQDQVSTITIKIDPYKSFTNGAFFKVLVLSSPDEPGLDYLSGFDFEWGYHCEVKVKKTKLAQPMMDAGDTEYELIEIVSKEKASPDYLFSLNLDRDLYLGPGDDNELTIKKVDVNTYRLMDEVNFTVLPHQQPILDSILAGEPRRCTFKFNEGGMLELEN
jgi:hypothetical protein